MCVMMIQVGRNSALESSLTTGNTELLFLPALAKRNDDNRHSLHKIRLLSPKSERLCFSNREAPPPETPRGQGHCDLASVPFWSYVRDASRDFSQIWLQSPVGLKDELIRVWCSGVKGQSQSG